MRLRLFRTETSAVARREQVERVEKAVAEGFRQLSVLLRQAAELIEARRLERKGYESQGTFLERTPPKDRR